MLVMDYCTFDDMKEVNEWLKTMPESPDDFRIAGMKIESFAVRIYFITKES